MRRVGFGRSFLRLLIWAFLLCVGVSERAASAPSAKKKEPGIVRGVVVVGVVPGGGASEAGILLGDQVLRWERPGSTSGPHRGEDLEDASAWASFELEEGPRGPVRLIGRRGDRPFSWDIIRRPWDIQVLPLLAPKFSRLPDSEQIAGALEKSKDWRNAAWYYLKASSEMQDLKAAEGLRQDALRAAEAAQDLTAKAAVFDAKGREEEKAKDFQGAREHYRRALAFREQGGGPLAPVKSLLDLAFLSQFLGESEELARLAEQAVARLEGRAPRSGEMARALNFRGVAALDRGNFVKAGDDFNRALAIWSDLAPESLDVARALNNLAIVAIEIGALKVAEAHHTRSLRIKEAAKADPLSIATSLSNLGSVAYERGDFERAETYHLRSLAIRERADATSIQTARSLNNLGTLAIRRHEWDRAEELLQRSLSIKERRSPNSLDVASGWLNLGALSLERGDLGQAQKRFEGYLERIRRLAPTSTYEANALVNLAQVEKERRQGGRAESLYHEAIILYQRLVPGAPTLAQALRGLAEVYADRGETERAEEAIQRAQGILLPAAPDSEEMAACLLLGAKLAESHGKREESLSRLRKAVQVHESCLGRLGGGSSARSGYSADTQEYYHALLVALADRGEAREAFAVLEKMRARELLRMLAQRDLVFDADIPQALDERRRLLATERDQSQSELMGLSPESDSQAITEVKEKLRRNGEAQERLREEILVASPRLAALQYPTPLDADKAFAALDPGTLALAYAVLPDETLLFALGPGPGEFSLHRIPIGAKALAFQVRRFRHFTSDPNRSSPDLGTLSRTLLRPVSSKIARAKRVLLCPDGPLLVLPFSALLSPGRGKCLAEVVPLHQAVSLTVWEELKKARPAAGLREFRVLALTDPTLPDALQDQGLRPLPAARKEGTALGALFQAGAEIYEGDSATEAMAKQAAPRFPFLHFACHGLLGGASPLDASLVLAPGEGENGILQAWEIFEGLRLHAELAVLSACDTGVGQAQGGEGLVGLSRAFQYAGARSLLVSHWRIDDATTAAFMRRFYRHLSDGMAKDEALKAAQNELARGEEGPEAARPAHWAAFQLVGDWK